MPAGCLSSLRRLYFCSAAVGTLLIANPGYAQEPSLRGSVASEQPSSPAGPGGPASAQSGSTSRSSASRGLASAAPVAAGGPDFSLGGSAHISESYVSNARGVAGARRADYVTTLTLNADLSQHSRRVNLDAHYGVTTDFYANSSVPTQISNRLLALGNVEVIQDYFNLSGRAFAQPVVVSDLGIVT